MKNPLLYWSARPESGREGREVFKIAQELVPEIEARIQSVIGADRTRALRSDLEAIRRDIGL